MDNIVLEYRDPIIGVILIVFLVFLISFFTYSYGIYKEKRARKDYRKLSKRFELGKLKEDDYINLYKTYNLPFDSILLFASTFLHKGDYNKAISVYLALLEHVKDRVKKEELLELLGTTYLKGGFLQRAKEVFLKVLKFSPRNKNVLKNLMLVCEKLKDYKKAKEITQALEELNVDVKNDKIYFDSLLIINDSILSYEKRTELLYEIFKENNIIERIFTTFLIQFNKEFFYNHISEFNCSKIIDILWYQSKNDIDFLKVDNNQFIKEIFNAKNYINNLEGSSDFELDILILINKQKKDINASLNFEFICTSCKHSHPFFESRCPHCHTVFTLQVKHHLCKSFFQSNQSLQ
ncbi:MULTISPECIES: tetratricopeptide repeat protein [Arcobacteraceae]|uniref:tetratricopeptide repeat protein n=1 Tax=Arcobacteraceae TaxID=2808963 RepID=UPI000DE82CF3|nr:MULTISPECIES: tetratricopeptide repeat protein [Arcobacteraceae]MBL3519463.1 tetratricopeptide repeat protein [Aliarcobacter lanthieri]RBQ26981.1 tetratricopeptide repeat protein [Arcobacter sp. CECT 9188]